MTTMTLRKSTTKPPVRAVPQLTFPVQPRAPSRPRPKRRPPAGDGTARVPPPPALSWLLGGGDTESLLDLSDDAVVRVEELRHDRVPATELRDVEQPGRLREVHRGVRSDDRPITVVREDLLGRVGVEEVDEGLRLLRVLGVLRHRDRVLDQDRVVGHGVVEVLVVLLGEDRVVLVGQQSVTLAAD